MEILLGLPELDNLARVGTLKVEPRSEDEMRRLLALARSRLADAGQKGVSADGRFTSAYGAAHAAALAALRWHGYRSENRITVFQCLSHTVKWLPERWRVLDAAHRKRNLIEYEGRLEVEESAVAELMALTVELIADLKRMIEPARK